MPRFLRPVAGAFLAALLAGCVIYDSGPSGPDEGRPFIEGRWTILASAVSSTCGFLDDEPFSVIAIQNGDLLQLVLTIAGFGEIRYDGRLDRDGEFLVSQRTLFAEDGLENRSVVEGRFALSGRTLTATEVEDVTDLITGRSCRVVWRWRGDRRS